MRHNTLQSNIESRMGTFILEPCTTINYLAVFRGLHTKWITEKEVYIIGVFLFIFSLNIISLQIPEVEWKVYICGL